MTERNIWHDAKTEKPKLARTVFDGAIRLQESEPVFLSLEFENGVTDYVAALYREATEITNGKEVTVDEYFAPIQGVFADGRAIGYDIQGVKAWMYPPKPGAINADWLIAQMNGDCDYCEHLTNLREDAPCISCRHFTGRAADVNNWELMTKARPSINEKMEVEL